MKMKKVVSLKMISLALGLLCALCAAAIDTSTTMVGVGDASMKLKTIIAYGLPTLWIETNDAVEPTCEYVYPPAGSVGATINAEKVPGRLIMYKRIDGVDSIIYDSGDYEKNISGMTIKVRGNTSAMASKKPYKIKLQKKRDLLMRGNDSIYKDKEWALMKDEYLFYQTGLLVSQQVGMRWNPANCYVNVIINGTYRGLYMLCETVKRNPDCRLNVDKLSGYIFECDPYWWNEPVYVNSVMSPIFNYTFKYPDDEDITEEQVEYMQGVVSAYEASITDGTYPELIDVRSFAAWCLIHDIMGTMDGGGANRYYCKYDSTADSKIEMPLIWDLDMAERAQNVWSRCHTEQMTVFFQNSNKAFVNEFVKLWCQLRSSIVDDVKAGLAAFRQTDNGRGAVNSCVLDNMVWGRNLQMDNYISNHGIWMTNRCAWLDSQIMALHVPNDVDVDGVVDITDVTTLIDMLLDGDEMITGDINGDGDVSIDDVTALIDLLLGS